MILVSLDKKLLILILQFALIDPDEQTPKQRLYYLAQHSADQLLNILIPMVHVTNILFWIYNSFVICTRIWR